MTCPTCGEDGSYYVGPPHVETLHFLARTIWDLHRLRLALKTDGRFDLASEVSDIINRFEDKVRMRLVPH